MKNRVLLFNFLIVLISFQLDAYNKTKERFDAFVDVFCWHTTESIDWATVNSGGNPDTVLYDTMRFHWDPGFRIGFGYNSEDLGCDTQFCYTWFQTQASAQASGSVTSGFMSSKFYGPYQSGKINFKIHFNMFDLDLGKRICASKTISFRPFIGIKGGWINQLLDTKWFFSTPGQYAIENAKNEFVGVGPRTGVNTNWLLGTINEYLFSLSCDFAMSYMWGNWTLKDFYTNNSVTPYDFVTTVGGRHFGALIFQGLLGVQMDFCFSPLNSPAHFKVFYEIQDWVSQLQIFNDITGANNIDLLLQGVTVELAINF